MVDGGDMGVFERRARGLIMETVSDVPEKPPARFGKDQTDFLDAMDRYYNVDIARRVCGLTPQKLQSMMAEDSEFFGAVKQAACGPSASIIKRVLDFALNGVEEELVYKGMVTGETVRKHKPEYMVMALKLLMPEKFSRDGKVVTLSSGTDNDLPDEEELIKLTDALL